MKKARVVHTRFSGIVQQVLSQGRAGAIATQPAEMDEVFEIAAVGGLHRRYERRAA